MKKVLFLYSSREGQTIKILHYIETNFSNYQCELVDIHQIEAVDFANYERVLIGASVRYGHLNKKLYQFIERNLAQLNKSKVAFFCVNLTARKEEQSKDTPEGSIYIRKFLQLSAWQPKLIGVFAGALYYPRYNWFDRRMIQLIMKMTGGETDASKEIEYTNWDKVTIFADKFKAM